MNGLFNKAKHLFDGHPGDAAGLCAGLALLVLAALFISGGGMAKVNGLFALNGVVPSSQTAAVFPCSFSSGCFFSPNVVFALYANTYQTTPGGAVTFTWNASTYGSNTWRAACSGSNGGDQYVCNLTPNSGILNSSGCNSYSGPGFGSTIGGTVTQGSGNCGNIDSSVSGNHYYGPNGGPVELGYGAHGGTYTVHPTVSTTYYFCSQWMNHNFGIPCISTPITVVQPSCPNGLTYGTYGPSCACPAGQVQSGASCVAPSCPNGLTYGTYGPSCACPAGQIQSGASCVPAPVCPTGYTGTPPNCAPIPPVSTPTALTSFTANPATVQSGSGTTLAWTGTKGTSFSACDLAGGQWGEGTWFTALPGSIATAALSTNTTYSMNCFDTDGTATGWKSAAVTVTAAPITDVCSNIPGVQSTVPANGHANADGTCSPNPGYEPDPSDPTVFIPVASCPGAHQTGTPPNCTCEFGFHWEGGICTQNMCSGQNETGWPSCSCASGYSRDASTNMCIHDPVLSIKVNGQDAVRVRRGSQVVVTWSASGITSESCSVRTNTGATIGSGDSGSVSAAVGNQSTYRLTCTNEAGTVVAKEANATLIPTVDEQ